jgi:predicted dehydrogenase
MVTPAREVDGVSLDVIAARDPARAQEFAKMHGIHRVGEHYQAVIDDPDIDAVYIALPISAHAEWAIAALEAGKHVLCEKSLCQNAREAERMKRAAEASGRVLMDAFHYRYHPMFEAAKHCVDSGELGAIKHIDARFHVKGPVSPHDIRKIYDLGGGVTMDIGCYPLSWLRHLMGEEPDVLSVEAKEDPADVDVALAADLRFPSGATGRISGRMDECSRFCAAVSISGEAGQLSLVNPLVPQLGHRYQLRKGGEVIDRTFDQKTTYAYQLEAFLAATQGKASNLTDAEDGLKQMQLIDAVYARGGLRLRGEGETHIGQSV